MLSMSSAAAPPLIRRRSDPYHDAISTVDIPLDRPRPTLTAHDLLPLVLLCALALFFHRPMLLEPGVLMGDDVLLQNLPTAKLVHEAIDAGRLPLWSPLTLAGYPLYAEGQAGLFYPPTLLLHKAVKAARDRQVALPPGPPWRLPLALDLFGHHLAFALLVYLLARHFQASATASFCAAVAVAWGGFAISHLVHANLMRAQVYLPLLWLFSLRATGNRDAGTLRDIAFHGVTLGLLFVAGHHQAALYIGLAWVALVLFLERTYGGAGWAWRTVKRVLWPTLLGVTLAAVQLLPTYELWTLSVRAGATTAAERFTWSFTPVAWGSWLLPFVHGSEQATRPYFGPGLFHELTSYVGVLPLFVIFLVRPWRGADAVTRFLLGFGAVGLMLAAGPVSPLYPVHLVPPFSFFRNPCRFLMWVELALALVAARALDRLVHEAADERLAATLRRYEAWKVLVLGTLFVGACTLVYRGIEPAKPAAPSTQVLYDLRDDHGLAQLKRDPRARQQLAYRNAAEGGAIVLALALAARCTLSAQAAGRIPAWMAAGFFALAGTVDSIGLFANRVWDVKPIAQVTLEPGPIEFLRTRAPMDRYALDAFPTTRPLDVYVKWRSHGANLYTNLAAMTGYLSPLTPRTWNDFFRAPDSPAPQGYDVALDTLARLEPVRDQWKLSLASVGWLMSTLPVASRTYIPRMSEDDVTLYRNTKALPRMYLVRAVRELKDGEDRAKVLAALNAKLPAVIIDRPGKPPLLAAAVLTARDSVSLTESHPEELYALANLSAPGWLVIADQAYPGWRAFVANVERPWYPACGLFRAVEIPAGISDIRWTFQPEPFRTGAWVTLFGLALSIVMLGASLFTLEPESDSVS